ncbi:MAG: hypothetical protein LBC03_03395 [Nitrososphaerota archaeon]|jgi:hypothetical protein|nr:hypothetical protein [Nitrososphaerota archaeon]
MCRCILSKQEVRDILTLIWEKLDESKEILAKITENNKNMYAVESTLKEEKKKSF